MRSVRCRGANQHPFVMRLGCSIPPVAVPNLTLPEFKLPNMTLPAEMLACQA